MTEDIKAYELAKKQKSISISEFFIKNRHLLGFDNPIRALLMTVKEAVDNSIDALHEMEEPNPEIKVEIKQLAEDRFRIIVEDNGPGIVKEQIPQVFGRLLYGSKFFKLSQSMGQQGLGISVSVLYSQLTTGKPTRITSKIAPNKPAYYYELHIDTQKNEPEVLKEDIVEWKKDHGTKVDIELEAKYQKGKQSVDEYLKQIAIVNPHIKIIYVNPENNTMEFPRATKELPIKPKEIKPHPYGIELGQLIQMLNDTKARTIQGFFQTDFCRVGARTAKEICNIAKIECNSRPSRIAKQEAENLYNAIQKVKIIAPPTDCLSPIKAELLEKGLKKELNAEFVAAVTRPPSVYRGMPFQIESAVVYLGSNSEEKEGQVRLLRFANRVPLLYQQGACAITEAVSETNWRPYGLQQSNDSLPSGPVTLVVHIASVWVPFTSEAKDAIAHYQEIIKEIKLALQECGRKLGIYIHKKHYMQIESKKRSYIEKYLPHIGIALKEIINLNENDVKKTLRLLEGILEKTRVKLDNNTTEDIKKDIEEEKNEHS